MLAQPQVAMHQLNKFYQLKVARRKSILAQRIHEICEIVQDILKEVETQEPRFISTLHDNNGHYDGLHVVSNHEFELKVTRGTSILAQRIHEICEIVQDILKEVETQEPRFISTLHDNNGHYDGLHVVSNHEFEIVLYLNQMGVFNFVDDGSLPGSAVLKLSDGRKRSMSLWVEFITASGYLSARKIRSRFQTLVAAAVDRTKHREIVKMVADTTEVKLRIKDRYIVQVTTAFRCAGIWPRSASQWPAPGRPWPPPNVVQEVKTEGFDLLSKELLSGGVPPSVLAKQQQQQSAGATGSALGSPNGGGPNLPLAGASPGSGTPNPAGAGANSQQAQATMEGDAWMMHFGQAEDLLLSHDARRRAFSILKTLKDLYIDPALPNSPITTYILKTLLLHECEKHVGWDEASLGDRLIGILLQLISCLQCRRCPHFFVPNLDLIRGKPHELLDRAAKVVWRLVRDLITNPHCLDHIN